MLLLHQSKSYTCESTLHTPELPTNDPLDKHHSLSLLDSIPVRQSVNSISSSLSTISLSISKTKSSSSSQVLSHTSSKSSLCKSDSLNRAFIGDALSNNQKIKRRKDKKSKYKVVTNEIALFTVRRNLEHTSFYFLNTTDTYKDDEDDEVLTNNCDRYGEMFEDLSNNSELLNNKIKINKYNKKVKLKTLIKNRDILSMIKPTVEKNHGAIDVLKYACLSNSKNSLRKKSSRLYIKYDLYKKLNEFLISSYVPSIDRMKYRYAIKRVDKSHLLSKEAIMTNKKVNSIVNRQSNDGLSSNKNSSRPVIDPPVVINNSLGDHNGASSELNQTYDALYLEFLISIQHRDITPEDYEYLSRLDEMVKKKTVSDKILKSLKCETITKEILEKIERDQEVCGICLDQYVIEQVRKHLPCGHCFHSDCIDNWLKNQSTNCPLDKIPVDSSASASNENKYIIQRNESLNEQPGEVEFDEEEYFDTICQVSCLLDEMIVQIENDNNLKDEVTSLLWDLVTKIEESDFL